MPGQKSIVWNDFNDSRLLQALCVTLGTTLTAAQCNGIAKLMGNGVTGTAIRHRVNTMRKRGASGCNATQAATGATGHYSSQKRPAARTPEGTPKSKRTKVSDDESDEDDTADIADNTPRTPGGQTRRSQRTTPSRNYATLTDPHAEDIPDDVEDLKQKLDLETDESDDEDFKPNKDEPSEMF